MAERKWLHFQRLEAREVGELRATPTNTPPQPSSPLAVTIKVNLGTAVGILLLLFQIKKQCANSGGDPMSLLIHGVALLAVV